jgi:aldehyde:ferredoxin oxidoreductase
MALAVLLVHEDGADIKPATDLWGQYTQQTNHTIRDREHGEEELC